MDQILIKKHLYNLSEIAEGELVFPEEIDYNKDNNLEVDIDEKEESS